MRWKIHRCVLPVCSSCRQHWKRNSKNCNRHRIRFQKRRWRRWNAWNSYKNRKHMEVDGRHSRKFYSRRTCNIPSVCVRWIRKCKIRKHRLWNFNFCSSSCKTFLWNRFKRKRFFWKRWIWRIQYKKCFRRLPERLYIKNFPIWNSYSFGWRNCKSWTVRTPCI